MAHPGGDLRIAHLPTPWKPGGGSAGGCPGQRWGLKPVVVSPAPQREGTPDGGEEGFRGDASPALGVAPQGRCPKGTFQHRTRRPVVAGGPYRCQGRSRLAVLKQGGQGATESGDGVPEEERSGAARPARKGQDSPGGGVRQRQGRLAQPAEPWISYPWVVGSTPTTSTRQSETPTGSADAIESANPPPF